MSNMALAVVLTWTLFLSMPLFNAVPICQKVLKFNEIGLCSPNGSVEVWHCASCQPGYGHLVECGRMYKTGTEVDCGTCKKGHTYSDKYDIGQCKPCTRCQGNEVQIGQCKPDKDTIRCTCKPGYYRDTLSRGCKPCSWCCQDGSNKNETECNIPQVPLGKRCSLQIKKSCAPTTPAPTAIPTSAITTTSTTEFKSSSTSNSLVPTTLSTKKSSKSKSPTTTDDIKKSSDSTEKKSTDFLFYISLGLIFLFSIVILALLAMYCHQKRRKESSSNNTRRDSSYGLDRNQDSAQRLLVQESRSGGTVALDPNNATAAFHVQAQRLLVQESRSGGTVALDPKNATAAFHVQGPNGTEYLPTTRLDQQQLDFICTKLGPRIENLKHKEMQILYSMLKVPINGKDYKNLDEFCKLNFYENRALESSENPVKEIIDVMIAQTRTLKSFLEELYRISRVDVVKKLYEVAKSKKLNI